jgi:hypothetical protein
MNMNLKRLAQAAEARDEPDFALSDGLVSGRDQARKLRVPGIPPGDDAHVMLLDHYLTRGRYFRPQPLPEAYRRGKPNQCYRDSSRLASAEECLAYSRATPWPRTCGSASNMVGA